MASRDPTYIQSDEIISNILSPNNHPINPSNSTINILRFYDTMCPDSIKPKARKRKFLGNRHTSKIVLKNILGKEDCLEVVPAVPIWNRNVDTVAVHKLVYQEEDKRKSISLEIRDDGYDDDVTTRYVYAVQGNYVIDLNSFPSILREVAMCRACEVGSLELFDSVTKESCATFLILRCNPCHFHSVWSGSGTFVKSSLSVSAF